MLSRLFFKLCLAAPLLIGQSYQTILLAPISNPVFGDDFIAISFVDIFQGAAQERVAQVADVKRFGDIGAGIFNQDRLFLSIVIFAIIVFFGSRFYKIRNKGEGIELNVNVVADYLGLGDEGVLTSFYLGRDPFLIQFKGRNR